MPVIVVIFLLVIIAALKEYMGIILMLLLLLIAIAVCYFALQRPSREKERLNTRRGSSPRSNTIHSTHLVSSPLSPSLQHQFRQDIRAYVMQNFPNVRRDPSDPDGIIIPDHLSKAYTTSNPSDLPYFGDARLALRMYCDVANDAGKLLTHDEFLDDIFKQCQKICDFHKSNLALEKRRLTRVDSYGNVFIKEWVEGNKGINYFIENVLIPSVGEDNWKEALAHANLSSRYTDFLGTIKHLVNCAADSTTSNKWFSNEMSGPEYEIFCAQILEEQGWQVEQTIATGDQGVDLIAIKTGMRVCIQCKRYSSPVGNSAVQQVAAGRHHWNGTHSVVVTNAGYTASAEELARSTSVKLLHHDDLTRLEKFLH